MAKTTTKSNTPKTTSKEKTAEKFHEVINSKDGRTEIKITIKRDVFDKAYEAALKEEVKNFKMKGFRKGKVPRKIVEEQVGHALQHHVLDQLMSIYIQNAIVQEGLKPIAPVKLKDFDQHAFHSHENKTQDITFTIEVIEMPKFKLGDLKKIKVEKPKIEATENEINQTIENIKNQSPNLKTDKVDDAWVKKAVKELGLDKRIVDMKSLKEVFSEVIKEQKQIIYDRQAANDVIEQALKLSKIEIPQEAIDYEASMREEAFINDIQQTGSSVEDVLKAQGRTIEQMREMWQRDAKAALEGEALLSLYAKERGIEITDEELAREVERVKQTVQDADSGRYDSPQWQNYIRSFLLKQKAYDALIKEVLGD